MTLSLPKLPLRSQKWTRKIETLDAAENAEEIGEILLAHVFPLDIFLSTEIGQLRTFTIPSISDLLHQTGQYEHDGVKRLDDTKAILREIFDNGLDSEHGQAMVEHLNRIHGFYNIRNDDYLYVLTAFFIDPVLWNERYGWREFTPHEKEATYNIYRKLGEAMKIREIPASFEEFVAWRQAYEAENQRFAESNYHVAMGLLNAAEAFVPSWLRWMVVPLLSSLLDKEFRDLLGLAKPNAIFYGLVQSALWIRKIGGRYFSLWEEDSFADSPLVQGFETYKNGYEPFQLGPTKLVKWMAQESK